MKICENCGAVNSDNRLFCLDCNEKLGDAVSEYRKERIEQSIDEKIEALYNGNDPLYVSLFDKVMGCISLVGIVACLVLLAVGFFTKREFGFLWFGVLLFALTAVEAFVPKLTWSIEKLRLSFLISNPDDTQPSGFYKICRKASIIITSAIGIVLLILAVIDFRYPPISDELNNQVVVTRGNSYDYIEANSSNWQE